jgi:hypothetical protein
MRHSLGLLSGLTLVSLFAVGIGVSSTDAQAVNPVPLPGAPSSYAYMPEPQAPFDETPITPVESAGASSTN